MDKRTNMLQFDFNIEGTISLSCDRCTSIFKQPISIDERLIVKLTGDEVDTTDDVVYFPQDTNEIDVGQFIYEFIMLDLPLIPTCDDAGIEGQECDQETIERINKLDITNKENKNDPRWDALKNLNLKS